MRWHTTLRVGGPARRFVEATTEQQLIDEVTGADEAGEPVLVLGGGSNLVVSDDGFPGTVVKVAIQPTQAPRAFDEPGCGGVMVTFVAGESWGTVVEGAVEAGWAGIETLGGIPGYLGAVPIQNVGAYGQEVSQTIARVRTWDRRERAHRTFANADCGFGYRTSRFKKEPHRYVVLDVTFQLTPDTLSAPIRYAELARALDLEIGDRAPLWDVHLAVLALRRGKGMVLDAGDRDTWSAGSFFTNPVIEPDLVPEGAPTWPMPDGTAKTSAAWLIERAGFGKGYGEGRARLSTKHTLALTNRGDATTAELLALARELRDGVEAAYGIRLVNEPVLVGCEL